jgi:carboxyl-terminal processing protease
MHNRRLWAAALVLWGGLSLASPAQDLFSEVGSLLQQHYGGFAQVRLDELRAKYQDKLEQACAQEVSCPTDRAVPLIQSLVSSLGDRHTRFFLPEAFAEVQRRIAGGYSSTPQLGVLLQVVPGLEGLLILEVSAGTPAEEAGLRRGDRILAVDGQALPQAEPERANFLRERLGAGGLVNLSIQRAGQQLEFQARPRIISLRQLPSLSLRPDGLAVLRIPSFTGFQQVGPRIHEMVRQAQVQGARAMVVDLRHNSGGLLSECLVGSGAFVGETYRRLQGNLRYSEQGFRDGYYFFRSGRFERLEFVVRPARWSAPVVLLVNERTASCAEYFAFDLQESGLAAVIGQPTAGVGNTATAFLRLSNGAGLQVTTSIAQRRDGSNYPERVTPDLFFPDDWRALAEGRDLMLERAIQLLSRVGASIK